MTRLTRRQKLLVGFCSMVAVAWGIDMLTGGMQPQKAAAAPTTAVTTAPVTMPEDPADLPDILYSLSSPPAKRAALEFDPDLRDPFALSGTIVAALPPDAEPPEGEAESKGVAAEPEPVPFADLHKLQGVMEGRVPLALIDGVLYRRGALIDGYRLEIIERDHVILRRGNSPVKLSVPATGRP